jgi:glycosyltransferase involved in cell wall biosynthesis
MAAGCPVVTSDRYGTKELAEGAAILVDPDSVESIASGMRQVLYDEPKRGELIRVGRHRSGEFQWTRCARETLRVLEQVQADRRSVPRRGSIQRAAATPR